MTNNLLITAPTGFEVRENGTGTFGASVSFTPVLGVVASKTIEVRLASSATTGTPAGNVVCSSTGASPKNVAVSGVICTNEVVTKDNEGTVELKPVVDITVNEGAKLTVTTAAEIHNITVQPGGKIDLTTELTATGNVTLKADDNNSFNAAIGTGKITATGTVNYVKTMQHDHWYFISFPCDVLKTDITLLDGSSLGTFGENLDWDVEYYDGLARSINKKTDASNWKTISGDKLEAYKGYIFWLKPGAGTVDVVFKLNKALVESESETSIPVAQNGVSNTIHDGWNLIGQPYLSKYAGGKAQVNYMTFPNADGGRTYSSVAKNENGNNGRIVDPFTAFFVQVASDGLISFSTTGRQSVNSLVETNLTDRVQLNFTTPTGTDNTNLVMDDAQSIGYKIGEDMVKWFGSGTPKPQVYTILGDVNYAYNALPMSSVVNLPVGFYTQTPGISTISVDATEAPGLLKLLLKDKTTGEEVDLLTTSYSFTASAGTNNTRFVITAERIITGNKIVFPENGTNYPTYEMLNGTLIIGNVAANARVRVYDAVGHCLQSRKLTNNSIEVQQTVEGVYMVQIQTNDTCWTKKIVLNK